MIEISRNLAIPETELRFTASRSAGPGGQNVNKVNTRVTLWFDVESSPSLSSDMKSRLRERLAGRIDRRGMLRVSSQRFRSQSANRKAAVERFVDLLQEALRERKARRKTRISQAAKTRRLQEKSRRGEIKRLRSKSPGFED